MNLEEKNNVKPSSKFLFWMAIIFLALGNSLHYSVYHYKSVNCRIIECNGFDYSAILFGLLGFISALMYFLKNSNLSKKSKAVIISLIFATLATLTYGLGLGPGDVCPDFDPNC